MLHRTHYPEGGASSTALNPHPLDERNGTDDESSFVMSGNGLTVKALKQIEQRWATAKDTTGMMDIFAEDAMFDDIDAQPVVGKDAIRAVYKLDEEGEERMAGNQKAVVLGSWGYSSGTWTVKHPDGRVDKGTYLNVVKLVDGEPKMFRQIFSHGVVEVKQ